MTIKAHRIIAGADLVMYAGSLVPEEVIACAKAGAERVDSSSLTLEETHALMCKAALEGKTVARVHTGDPSIYGATREQAALLKADGIDYEVVPGVSAAFAAAAAAKVSFTVPEVTQSLVITRLHGRTPVPPGQRPRDYAAHGGSLAIYLSAGDPEGLVEELRAGGVSEDTPIVMAGRVGWPDENIVKTTLADLAATANKRGIGRQTVFLVLPGEKEEHGPVSRLYAKDFKHGYRV